MDNISLQLSSASPPAPPSPAPAPSSPPAPAPPATTPTPPPATTPTPPAATTPTPPPATQPAKPWLSLACAGKTLVATVRPATGTKVSSVWFYANGKVKAKDRRAPFVAAIATKGLNVPLKVAVAIQASGKSTFLRKQFRGC